jgi:hypothetical protein
MDKDNSEITGYNSWGLNKEFYDYLRNNLDEIVEKKGVDNTHNNEKFLSDQFKDLLKISDEDMRDKDKDWLKSKIRQFKIDIMCNGA